MYATKPDSSSNSVALGCVCMENITARTSESSSPLPDRSARVVTNYYEVRTDGPPSFKWTHLWGNPIVNPVNLKSYTLPILNLNNSYSRIFHLSWRE
jgi:MFS transporter, NNP family, nitrate/nitrite transporter